MAETAEAVAMTCIEHPRKDVEGVDARTFTLHAVIRIPSNLEEIYITKIIEPAIIADGVISEPILLATISLDKLRLALSSTHPSGSFLDV
jgi:hypothetical protein